MSPEQQKLTAAALQALVGSWRLLAELAELQEALMAEDPQLYYDLLQVKEQARHDMDFFAGLAMPDVATLRFPNFYRWLWGMLVKDVMSEERKFPRYAIGLPRGHGKTMVVKLLLLLAILYSTRRYMLVIGANLKRAAAIISDICDMLDSTNIQTVYGNWRFQLEKDTQDLKKFYFNGRPVILEAAGQGTAIRGSNQKNERPDLILFDDAQTKECAESLVESEAFSKWFVGTAMKSKSPRRCLYIYIGNMYKDIELSKGSGIYCCMLRNLVNSSAWTSFVVGGILADGTALWEELQPLEQLLTELQDDIALGQADVFFAEVLNDPQATTSYYIDPTKVRTWDLPDDMPHQGNYIIIDPATDKETPDKVVIGYHEIYDNVPYLVELIEDKLSSPDLVMAAIQLALRRNCSLIIPESNAYQYSLVNWFEFFFQQMGIVGMHCEPIYTKGVSKNSRIMTNMKAVMAGDYRMVASTREAWVFQALAFKPNKTNNVDDILDMAEMGLQAAVKFRHLMHIDGDLSLETRLGMQGIPDQYQQPSESAF